jgi:acetolactate synthase-1/2/3 large subunit
LFVLVANACKVVNENRVMSAFVPPETPPAPAPVADADRPARRARDRKRRGADAVVDVLVDAGVTRIFGLPGGAISPLVDALLDEPRLRPFTFRHEATAAFAACGLALETGRVAALYTTSGPGLTNALTGIASAFCDAVPLVVLVGEVPRAVQGRGAIQDGSSMALNIATMLRPVTKAVFEATDANTLPHLVHRALRVASSGRRGPVAVIMPLDAQLGVTIEARMAAQVTESYSLADDVMSDVAARVMKATRPAIFAGNGARDATTAAALRAFAEHTGIPVMTTPKGKGVFPEDHPLSLGIFGLGGHASARRYLEEHVDCLIALGTRFGDLATDGWSRELYPTRTLIHVDIDGSALARNYTADVAVVAPACVFLDDLRARLPAPPARCSRAGGIERQEDASLHPSSNNGLVSPARLMLELQKAMPSDTIWVVDSGEHALFAHHWLQVSLPDAFLTMSGLGAMGSSTGVAIGAALAHPGRRVCVILGDGGFLMTGQDVVDAAAFGLDVTFVVMNDRSLRMVELGHESVYGRTPSFTTPDVDVVAAARAFGAASAHVVTSAELPDVSVRGVHVLDVKIDPAVRIHKRDRVAAMRRESGG